MIQGKQVRQLGATGLVVSPLGLGTNKWAYGKNDEAVAQTFRAYVDAGGNFFDTAEVYGSGNPSACWAHASRKTHDRQSSPANTCRCPCIRSSKHWMAA